MKRPKVGTKIWLIDGLSIRSCIFKGTHDGWWLCSTMSPQEPESCYGSKEAAVVAFLDVVRDVIKRVLTEK